MPIDGHMSLGDIDFTSIDIIPEDLFPVAGISRDQKNPELVSQPYRDKPIYDLKSGKYDLKHGIPYIF